MRWHLLILAILAALSARPGQAIDFPYTAYVNSTDVYVRSGPGRDYYPTDKLQKGEAVEVYRHDPGGWLAIRPPRGSFSWVTSRHVDVQGDNLAVVNADRVVARVGSNFSDVRDVIQVRLQRDEKLVLLEPPVADSPWCKAEPPAGEFRWIFAKYVDRELPADLAEDARQARDYLPADGDSVRLTGGDPASEPGPQPAADPLVAGELERLRELERVDMELSEVVAGDISNWSFDDLQKRAEFALRAAQGSLERGRARVLLDKLARFDDIKRRHDALRKGPQRVPAIAGMERLEDARFDGMGRLSPVVSQKTGGPQFALLDESGAVLKFVTPAPGVNLRPYVDQYIGVNGQRGYLTDLQRQHVSVQRITVLDAGVQRR
jgi:SH3-like domain-containing protein